jgi:hypothetical protein
MGHIIKRLPHAESTIWMLYVCDFVSPRQTQNQGPLIINYLRQNAKK